MKRTTDTRRASRIVTLLLAVLIALPAFAAGPAYAAPAAGFSDVPKSHWAYIYITRAEIAGVISGMGDGSFDPDGAVTQAQFISIAVRACGIEPAAADGGKWYDGYISAARDAGLREGSADIDPGGPITRYMMAVIVCAAMEYLGSEPLPDGDAEYTLSQIPDEIPEDLRAAVAGVYAPGIIAGMDDTGRFAGDEYMTRAQSAVVYCRMRTFVETGIKVNGVHCRLGMTERELLRRFGEPKETLTGVTGLKWIIFEGYSPFFAAGINEGCVSAIVSAGSGFVFLGAKAGDMPPSVMSRFAEPLEDDNDGGIMHGIYIAEHYYTQDDVTLDADTLYCEARLNFGLVNAFRVMHGLSSLEWSGEAETAGRLHCEDMAKNGYFAHESPDGRAPADRISAQGVTYRAAGENIYKNSEASAGGIAGYFHLVNSAGHREVMLFADFDHLGVGCAYDELGGIYLAEEFWAAR